MTAKTPKVTSTRLSLPLGVAGSEPTDAPVGSLAYATDTELVRVKKVSGWDDVGGGGSATPTGPAGGDLGGTYPNPTVTQARGLKSATTTVAISGATAPSAGQVLTATSSTAADWETPSGAPTGAAGGDLAGTYPNPTVTQARGLKSATTTVAVSAATAPSSGQVLTATGASAATWQTPSASGVTTVAAGTGISVASPTGPTATVSTNFGTSSTTSCVGNDSRLSDSRAPNGSASGDLAGSYPSPTVTQARGLLSATTTVSVSAATAPTSGQALVATGSAAATWQTLSSTLSLRDPVWDPPTTAAANDDEFTADTIASGAWTFITGAGVTMTRDGTFDLTQACASGHYRSVAVGSTVYLQTRANEQVFLYKTVAAALSTNLIWFLGIGFPVEPATASANNPAISLGFYRNSGGSLDFSNRSLIRTGSSNDHYEILNVIASAATTVSSNTFVLLPLDGLALRVNHGSAAAANITGFGFRRTGSTGTLLQGNGVQFNQATDKVAIGLISNASGTVTGSNNAAFALHFFRSVPANNAGFLAQS